MSLEIHPLDANRMRALEGHLARHRKESGQDGDIHFMPFEPGLGTGPRPPRADSLGKPLDEPGWERWWIALDPTGPVVGHVELAGSPLAVGLHRCELGIGLERPHRGQGVGRALMEHAIEFARLAPLLEWIDLRVFAHNTPGRRLYTSLGFTEVGTTRDQFRIGGEMIDDVRMTLRLGEENW